MNHVHRTAALAALLLAGSASSALSGPVEIGHLYELSDFAGTIPCDDARIVLDDPRHETYTLWGNTVRIFNGSGMHVFTFTVDPSDSQLIDLAVDPDGGMLLLTYPPAGSVTGRWTVRRADYRGRPKGELALALPAEIADFGPNRMLLRGDTLWLVSEGQLLAATFALDGTFRSRIDLAKLAEVPDADRPDFEIRGFDAAADGSYVFAVPVQFRVYVASADGSTRAFGRSGSAAGNFGIISSVAFGDFGHVVVSDRLRNVVMVFDETFRFLREFGSRGNRGDRLTRPGELAIGNGGKLYVSQLRNKGVAVFAMTSENGN